MNKFTYTDFYNQYIGQSSQLGGYYNQCVTLFKCFLEKAGYPNPGRAIGGSGGAREIWYRKDELGYGDYFEYTQVGQPGDWFIWDSVYGWYEGVYYGHVAMLIQDNGNGTGQFLGMNQDYSLAPASIMTLTYDGSCGVLRYKGYGESSSTSSNFSADQLIEEKAVATFTVDQLNARVNDPNGWVCRQYTTGDSVEYSYKWVGNGHRYICWYEAENLIMVAVNGNEQGTEPWADFSEATEQIALEDEYGWAKYKVDGVNVRKDSYNGEVVKTINTGDVVEYTQKCVTSEHRYISYQLEGQRYFVACSPTSERSTEWADFYDSDPSGSTADEDTHGFTSVGDGVVENPDQADETLDYDDVTVDLIPKNLYQYKCPYVMEPKTIVIHNAATPSGTAKKLNNALHNNTDYKSWHFSVDDKNIIESLPLNRNAFATGDGAFGHGNRTGIHIEIAKDLDTDSEADWKKSRKNGAKLAAILLKKYNWDISHISKHQDYLMTDGTYKYCPHKILDEGWEDFVALIQSELDAMNGQKSDDSPSDGETDSNSEIKETNSLLKALIELIKKIFNIK